MPDTDSGDVRKSDRADGRTSGTMRTKISYYLPAVLVVLLAMGGYDILRKSVSYYFMNPYAQSGLPGHVEEMFMSFDQDLDGYIGRSCRRSTSARRGCDRSAILVDASGGRHFSP